jgi:steroid delta-isomerase
VALFTQLDSEGVPSLDRLAALSSDDVHFRDPFNDLRGREALHRLLAHTRQQVSGARFEVLDTAWSGRTAYLRWTMTGRLRWIGDWRVVGVSEIRFGSDGRVAAHLDYWDAAEQFYGLLPLIGPLVRLIRSALRVS